MRLARRYNPYSLLPSNRLEYAVGIGVSKIMPFPTAEGSYLVDPASSHMLVSKIKPCMSKYKLLIL